MTVTRKQVADASNQFQVEFLNRANQYNVQIAEAKDQAQINLNGLRPNSPLAMHFVCEQSTAQNIAQVMMQRSLYVRNEYAFKLGWGYIRLEPMDIVTITDSGLGLNRFPVRITKIDEDNDGLLSVAAEELAVGTAVAPRYQSQVPAGYTSGANDEPGDANAPVIFVAPYLLSGGDLEAWMAISGGDSWGGCDIWVSTDRETYSLVGTQNGPARQGELTANIDAYPTSTLSVALDNANLQLLSGSASDANNLVTICYADGELIAYETATLVTAGSYNLTGLVRGAYSTTAGPHNSGSDFARLDTSIFKYPFQQQLVGQTIYVKLVSFNVYGNNKQSLDEVNPYVVSLAAPTPGAIANLAQSVLNNSILLTWTAPASILPIDHYSVSVGSTYSTSTTVAKTAIPAATITTATAGAQTYWITPVDTSGQAGSPISIGSTPSAGTSTGDVTLGTANGLSLSGQSLSLQPATNSQPGALTAADHTLLSTALQPGAPSTTTFVNADASSGLGGTGIDGGTIGATVTYSGSGQLTVIKTDSTAFVVAVLPPAGKLICGRSEYDLTVAGEAASFYPDQNGNLNRVG